MSPAALFSDRDQQGIRHLIVPFSQFNSSQQSAAAAVIQHLLCSLAGANYEFLEKGGILAWGIVPTSEKINTETPESLVKKLKADVKSLAEKGIEESLIWDRCLVTPSCGTGSLTVDLADNIFSQLPAVSKILRS